MLAPIVFAGRLTDPTSLALTGWTALAFCLVASGGYVLNDLHDRAADRHHPEKRLRPLAAGTVDAAAALALALLLLGAGISAGWHVQQQAPPLPGSNLLGLGVLDGLLVYLGLGALYTLGLKRILALDVLALSAFFVLRPVVGAAALQLLPSRWLLLCGAALALFLALGKRRLELANLGGGAAATRPMFAPYRLSVLDVAVDVAAGLAVLSWVLYAVAPDTVAKLGSRDLLWLTPLVAWLVLRHRVQIRRGLGHDPVRMLLDDGLAVAGFLLWCVGVLLVVYQPW